MIRTIITIIMISAVAMIDSGNVQAAPTTLTIEYCRLPLSISGNVFVDYNKNKLFEPSPPNNEKRFSKQAPNIEIHNQVAGKSPCDNSTLVPNIAADIGKSGQYNTGAVLVPGTYYVCYTNKPDEYLMTFPTGITSPYFFAVIVGDNCSIGISNSAKCKAGNIEELNFGITNSFPWIQSKGQDMRVDSGYSEKIPKDNYASLPGSGGMPGIIFSGNSIPIFGNGSASKNPHNWVVGGAVKPNINIYTSSHRLVTSSYEYQASTALDNGLTPVNLEPDAISIPNPSPGYCGAGGRTNCVLASDIPNGLYIANGDLSLNNPSTYTFPANKNYVILVNGNLTIKQNILLQTTSTASFFVKGDIYVDKSIGESTPSSTVSNLDGFYSTDKNFIVETEAADDCPTSDKRLNIGGVVITNASLSSLSPGKLVNRRDLCGENPNYPTIYFSERLDLILNAPRFIQQATRIYKEVPPR